ncbi:MAG: hypothetical protein OEZ19_00115 [Paracoccaceae bacterium]|nr:hypothetical protein [Paracoccaceae bacterium]
MEPGDVALVGLILDAVREGAIPGLAAAILGGALIWREREKQRDREKQSDQKPDHVAEQLKELHTRITQRRDEIAALQSRVSRIEGRLDAQSDRKGK